MQTFIPLATFNYQTMATYLDNKRLNKQALEGWQILMTLLELDPEGNDRQPRGWVNHPAVKMWRRHEAELYKYVIAMTTEWKARGFKTTIDEKATATIVAAAAKGKLPMLNEKPGWMYKWSEFEKVASSHRTALLNKDYEWYSQFAWPEDKGKPDTYEYVWPI